MTATQPHQEIGARETQRRPGDSMPDVLYILSPSYSGSTLLTFSLASHPEISTVGELKASAIGDIATYHCSCGALLTQCEFWLAVQKDMRAKGGNLDFSDFDTHLNRVPMHFKKIIRAKVKHPIFSPASDVLLNVLPDCRSRLKRTMDQNLNLVESVNRIQKGRVFLDGSKDPERVAQFLKRLGPKVKIVRLLRDGRGVTNSYMKHYQVGMEIAAVELVKVERACDRVMTMAHPGTAMTIRYEDFCANPSGTLQEIYKLAGLNPEPPSRRSAAGDFHILGNAMRLDFGKPIAMDEKWRKMLTEGDLKTFYRITGQMNRTHGYE